MPVLAAGRVVRVPCRLCRGAAACRDIGAPGRSPSRRRESGRALSSGRTTPVTAERIDADCFGTAQPPVSSKGMPVPPSPLPEIHPAAHRVAAEPVGPLDEHHVHAQPRRRQRRAESAAAAADHREFAAQNSRDGIRARSVRRDQRCQQQQGGGEVRRVSLMIGKNLCLDDPRASWQRGQTRRRRGACYFCGSTKRPSGVFVALAETPWKARARTAMFFSSPFSSLTGRASTLPAAKASQGRAW